MTNQTLETPAMDSSEVHKPSNTSPPSQNVKPLFIARLLRVNDINFPLPSS